MRKFALAFVVFGSLALAAVVTLPRSKPLLTPVAALPPPAPRPPPPTVEVAPLLPPQPRKPVETTAPSRAATPSSRP